MSKPDLLRSEYYRSGVIKIVSKKKSKKAGQNKAKINKITKKSSGFGNRIRVTKFFHKSNKRRRLKIMLIGGGDIGFSLAAILEKESQIIIVENDHDTAEDLANRTNFLVVQGDGVDPNVLREAGLHETDAFVAATNDDKTNLMGCQIAKNAGVKKIVSFVNSPKNEAIFLHAGVANIVSKVGSAIVSAKKALYERINEKIVHLIGTEAQIVELPIGDKSLLIGKKAKIKNTIVAAILRKGGSEVIIPPGETTLTCGDSLLVIARTNDIPNVLDSSGGK